MLDAERLGKQHLATLLIGAGLGNLDVEAAVRGLLSGLARALSGTQFDGLPGVPRHLQCVTIVEFSASRLLEIGNALERIGSQFRDEGRLDIDYALTESERQSFARAVLQEREKRLEAEQRKLDEERHGMDAREGHSAARPAAGRSDDRAAPDPSPARLAFVMKEGVCVFSAIIDEASIPERAVELDTDLVEQTNDRIVAAETLDEQKKQGRVLGRLLMPRELRDQFRPGLPLVMQMDARSARIHWEMVAQSAVGDQQEDAAAATFLGLERGFTRQLRTAFAPPPEAPPVARRTLRVLIVADPAADAPLRGAMREAAEVADLFEAFNQVYQSEVSTEVVRLFGPTEADRLDVMTRLLLEQFDVLHYAGHCFFNAKDPPLSGWIFRGSPRLVLSARELRLIDRVPRFVFSNACESGITPDRPDSRIAAMAPSFAEAFFERGVANFICTAWPVDDAAARLFARQVYAGLLGLKVRPGPEMQIEGPRPPLPLYRAMQEARQTVAALPYGLRTWGAYQHYGNPHARFFTAGIHARPRYAETASAADGPTNMAAEGAAPANGPARPAAPSRRTARGASRKGV